ncbi:IclR family transcriptional regulator [Neptunicella sp. SCSIO 80796]|uniref:IclR family transcriptional regulator n=1 Tax=Neptunicella plasticusilytica TaxID=3117012 RepID=UPI003A4D808E
MLSAQVKMKPANSASAENEKIYTAPALEKGLDILELLADESEGLKLKDIAARLQKSVSEIFRMVSVLERRQYLTLDDNTDKYSLSLKLFEVAHRHVPIQKLVKAASLEMENLTKKIDQSCHLTICAKNKVMVVVQKDSPMDKLITIRLGASAPLLNSCSGHIFIAFSSEQRSQELLSELEDEITQDELDNLLSIIRGQGFERMLSKQIQGVEDIGFPIYDYNNELIACLVVPYLHYIGDLNSVNINTALREIGKTARQISYKLGARTKDES